MAVAERLQISSIIQMGLTFPLILDCRPKARHHLLHKHPFLLRLQHKQNFCLSEIYQFFVALHEVVLHICYFQQETALSVSLCSHLYPNLKPRIYFRLTIMPRMLCNENGVLPHLQMGVAMMGFVEDFCYSLHNS